MAGFKGGEFGYTIAELRAERGQVVGEERCLVAGAGDGDIAKSRIVEARVDAEVALGCEAAGNCEW